MLRKTIFAAAPLIAMAVISGCGSTGDQELFKCSDVAISNGAQSVCEAAGAAFGSGGGGAGYDCVPVSSVVFIAGELGQPGACPPGTAPSSVGTGAGGHAGGTSDGTGPGSSGSTPVGSDGTTTSGGNPSGSDGTTTSGGNPSGSDGTTTSGGSSGNPNGSDGTASSGGTSSGASGGGGGGGSGGGGGGYQCTTSGGQTTCVSTTCEAGFHKSPCGTCVPSSCSTCSCGGSLGCSYTQGYWKNHAAAWPVASLKLGGTNYTKAQLLAIFDMPTRGDASLILAHQLIAAMLNVASGASDAPIKQALADAHTWLSANAAGKAVPFGVKATSAAGADAVALAAQLDAYNNGNSGIPHCN